MKSSDKVVAPSRDCDIKPQAVATISSRTAAYDVGHTLFVFGQTSETNGHEHTSEACSDEHAQPRTHHIRVDDKVFVRLFDVLIANNQRYRAIQPMHVVSVHAGCKFANDPVYVEGIAAAVEEWFECSLIDDEYFDDFSDDLWQLGQTFTRERALEMLAVFTNKQLAGTEETYERFA